MIKIKRITAVLCILGVLLPFTPVTAKALNAPSLPASHAVVIDGDTGEVLFEKNAYDARPVASMTKVMSMYIVYEEMAAGRMTMDTMVTASAKTAAISNNPEYSGMERLRQGGQYRVGSLMEIIMTASCNGAVVALAEHVAGSEEAFVARMNATAAKWGMTARFADCTGIVSQGNAVTPYAMALIAKKTIDDYPDILRLSAMESAFFQGKTFYTTNRMLREGSYAGIDGLKSGTTSWAGRCYTGTAKRNDRRVISVVMNASTNDGRVADTRKLLDYGFARITELDALRAGSAAQTKLTLSTAEGPIYPYATRRFDVALSGVTEKYAGHVQWIVNGQVVEQQKNVWAEDGKVLSLQHAVPAGAKQIAVGVRLTAFGGRSVYQEKKFDIYNEPLTFKGYMGVREVSVYQGAELIVPVTVRSAQNLSLTVGAGWHLDGVPLQGFTNPAFKISADAKSTYRLKIDEHMTPGEHTLAFICNTAGLAGIERTEFTTVIHVLAPEETVAAAFTAPAEEPIALLLDETLSEEAAVGIVPDIAA